MTITEPDSAAKASVPEKWINLHYFCAMWHCRLTNLTAKLDMNGMILHRVANF